MSWYKTGFQQPNMAKQRSGGANLNRVWVKPGTKERGMFMDSDPCCIYEHNPYLDGSWRNQHTCSADSPEGCPLCEIGNEPEYVGFLTWASFTPWPDSKGVEHTFTKKLFPMKQKVWKLMTAAAEKRGGDLTGWVVECARFAKEEPSTGLSYDFEERIPQSEWKAKFGSRIITYGDQTVDTYLQPMNYEAVLAPKPHAELKRLANRLKYKGGEEGGNGDAAADDDLPF